MKQIKDHWRNISKSDFLASVDVVSLLKLNGRVILTIERAEQKLEETDQNLPRNQQFTMNGKRGDFNIIYFKEDVKPMVANMGNSEIMFNFVNTGNDDDVSVAKWAGLTIELYVESGVKLGKERVDGIRIMNKLPIVELPSITPGDESWEKWRGVVETRLKEGLLEDHIRDSISKHFTISNENWILLVGVE